MIDVGPSRDFVREWNGEMFPDALKLEETRMPTSQQETTDYQFFHKGFKCALSFAFIRRLTLL